MKNLYDVMVVGGGFYGCMIAQTVKNKANKVLVVEKEPDILTRASYNNQARVHNGYHYPRSLLTASRSHHNYQQFIDDFSFAIDHPVQMLYAIARTFSKVTSTQFIKFADQIGSPLSRPSERIARLFSPEYIEQAFVVEEKVFNAALVRKRFAKNFKKMGIDVMVGNGVQTIEKKKSHFTLTLSNRQKFFSRQVFVSTYSTINTILRNSKLPLLPFKYEWTEMPLVTVPKILTNIGITIMDGPFMGVVPFPDRKLHTLHHVRYTPFHTFFHEKDGNSTEKLSRFNYMVRDTARYIPILSDMKYNDSLYEVRTVLTQNESDDGRPILYRKNYVHPGLYIVMGGKIDNIYDVLRMIASEKDL